MKHKFNLILSLLLFSITLMAQDTLKQPTLENLMPGGNSYLFTENIYGLNWWGDTCLKPGMSEIKAINPSTGKEEVFLKIEDVNAILSSNKMAELTNLYQVEFPWDNEEKLLITREGKYISLDWKNKTVEVIQNISTKAENIDYQIKANQIAYTIEGDLWVNNKKITQNLEGVVAGETVHRSEFGIRKGTFWSPSGSLLAFYKKDESMVTEYPLVDITTRIATVENVRYPMAGMPSHKVEIGIYDVKTEKITYLNTGDPTDRFFTNISWAPDEKSVYLIEVNRDQNHAQLCQFDIQSGELIQVLYEESHPKYVEPQNPIVFLPWNNKQFIYQSEKDGFNHLYLYDVEGKLIRQLTQGEWLVQSIVGFNEKQKEIILTTTTYSPLQSNLIAVSVNSGKSRSLDNKEGVHRPNLSTSGKYLIDNYSSPNTPRSIDILSLKSNKRINLLNAEDPYKDYQQPEITIGTIKAADGKTDLYYRLVKSKDIDTSKKHPAIIYVYGGPHAQMINAGWNYGVRGWDIYMANKGYVVFTLDNRGSDNRGIDFENATFRELGIKEAEDQVKGVDFLKSLGYIDMNRIGVHGWSFGGHMTTALMLHYPNIFKVGVAGGPVIKWEYYEIMYGERYMDTPQSNPEGYKKTNLCNFANQLKGHLLLIHDDHDSTCVPQHTLSFLKACIDARTYPDLFIYPGHAHNVIGKDRVHLYEKITRYFEDYL